MILEGYDNVMYFVYIDAGLKSYKLTLQHPGGYRLQGGNEEMVVSDMCVQ